jgi:2-methylcitrate dehydratase PrpD
MDVIFDLAKNIIDTRYEDLPQKTVDIAKQFIIDTIGVGISGSSVSGNAEIIDLLKEWGGKKESTILVYGIRVPAPEAAFANSIFIHSNDYDEGHGQSGTHNMVTVFPATLAIAEKMHSSGKALITAITLGVDLTCRLALASNLFSGWHYTATVGVFGATAAAGKMLGLDEAQMLNALGIAYSQAAGNRQGRQDGALTKRLQPPFSSKAGVLSAMLAQRGVTGAQNVIEGEWGFFRLYHDPIREYEPSKWAEALKSGLGTHFEMANSGAKPYPCVGCAHAPIDGAIELAIQHDIKPENVKEVIIYTNKRVLETAGGRFVIRANPLVDAQFSIPYTIAIALTRRTVTLGDFQEKIIRDPEIGRLADRVTVVVDPEFKDSRSIMGPIKIRIKMNDGKEYERRVEVAKGHPENPMSETDFLRKFEDCVKHSVKPISGRNIEKLLPMLEELEKVDDIATIVGLIR